MADQKRFIIAILLIVFILYIYSYVFKPKPVPVLPTPPQKESFEVLTKGEVAPSQTKALPQKEEIFVPTVDEEIIETPTMRVVLSTKGASIRELYLGKETDSNGNGPLKLLRAQDPKEGILAIEEFNQLPLSEVVYKKKGAFQNKITYTYTIEDEYEITKTFTFPKDNYNIELQIKITNLFQRDKSFSYSLIGASRINRSLMLDKRFSNIGVFADDYLQWQSFRQIKKAKTLSIPGKIGWVVFRNTHYSAIIKPHQATPYAFIKWLGSDKAEGDQFLTGLKTEPALLSSGSSITHNYTLYVGPTALSELEPLGLERAVHYGKLNPVCQFLMKALGFFYGVFHNYGVAIIMLSILISIFTYPLTLKNLKSMRQMQAVQPHLTKLREIHKDNQRKLQSETMKLYREHKVNPLGGCLPMVLQMPIFISLYVTLARSTELKGASFLWIKDLALPDSLAKMPFSLPVFGDTFNLLPIIMTVAMMVQQKISMSAKASSGQSAQEKQQGKMMMLISGVFLFIFYNFPSGLVLYWTTNTILMALTYYLIQKRLSKTTPIQEAA